jgi:hypothetical protein
MTEKGESRKRTFLEVCKGSEEDKRCAKVLSQHAAAMGRGRDVETNEVGGSSGDGADAQIAHLAGGRMLKALVLAGLLLTSAPALCVGIFDDFGSGFGGVQWTMSRNEVMTKLPGGYQVNSNSYGQRAYIVGAEDSFLGVARLGSYVAYHFSARDNVQSIQVYVPFNSAAEVYSKLMTKYGPTLAPKRDGIMLRYFWPTDHGVRLSFERTEDPGQGFAYVEVYRSQSATAHSNRK